MDSLLHLAEVAASLDGKHAAGDAGKQMWAAPHGMPQSAGITGGTALQHNQKKQDAQSRIATARSSTETLLQQLQQLKEAIVTQQQASQKQQQQQCNQAPARTSPSAGRQVPPDAGHRTTVTTPETLHVDEHQPINKKHQVVFDQHLNPRPAAATALPPPPPPLLSTVAAAAAAIRDQTPAAHTSSASAAAGPGDDCEFEEDVPPGGACEAAGAAGSRQAQRWSQQEHSKLEQLVELHGLKAWRLVAEQLPGRSGKQCRERYLNYPQEAKKVCVCGIAKRNGGACSCTTYPPQRVPGVLGHY